MSNRSAVVFFGIMATGFLIGYLVTMNERISSLEELVALQNKNIHDLVEIANSHTQAVNHLSTGLSNLAGATENNSAAIRTLAVGR